jgi:hypothetical protein
MLSVVLVLVLAVVRWPAIVTERLWAVVLVRCWERLQSLVVGRESAIFGRSGALSIIVH